METVVTAAEARERFDEILDQVARGETVFVERKGRSEAVVISVAAFDRLLSPGERLGAWLAEVEPVRARLQADLKAHPPLDPAELVQVGRQERDDGVIDPLR